MLQRCARLARGWRVRHVAKRRSKEGRKTLQQSFRLSFRYLSGAFPTSFLLSFRLSFRRFFDRLLHWGEQIDVFPSAHP